MLKKIIDRLFSVVDYKSSDDKQETLTITGIDSQSKTWSADNLHVSNLSFSDLYETCQK